MSVVSTGIAPAPGDEVLVSATSVYLYPDVRWLLVDHVEPCNDPAWAWLTGTWVDDGSRGRVMAWLDRVLVRKTQLNPPARQPAGGRAPGRVRANAPARHAGHAPRTGGR